MVKIAPFILFGSLAVASCSSAHGNRDPIKTFEMLDRNADGAVGVDEWQRSVDEAVSQLPSGPATDDYRSRLIRLFEQLDVNRDHQLSPAEWRAGKFESRELEH